MWFLSCFSWRDLSTGKSVYQMLSRLWVTHAAALSRFFMKVLHNHAVKHRSRIRLREIFLFAVKSSLLKRYSHGFRKSAAHNSISSESSAFPPRVKSVQYWNWSTLSRHHYPVFIGNNNTIWRCRSLYSHFQQTYVFFNDKLPYHQKKLNVY